MSVVCPGPIMQRSRAVKRIIEPGDTAVCAHCDESVKFKAREKHYRVICNVYEEGSWVCVEHYHHECYEQAGQPYGPPDASNLKRVDIRLSLKQSRRR